MRVLITGGAGYLGAVLAQTLLADGHKVDVLDNFQHGVPSLAGLVCSPRLTITRGDCRAISELHRLAKRADVLIPLAGVVGAPGCARDPVGAITMNARAVHDLVDLAAKDQLILYPNTNSGYGIGGEKECTEESPLNPVSLYGKTKVEGEGYVLQHLQGVSFRLATLFGFSPRMRLDLMVNDFVHRAVRDKALVLFEGGFRRNFLHVRDAAGVFLQAILHPSSAVEGKVFNVGDSRVNLTKRQLCKVIAEYVPGFIWHEAPIGEDPDKRDYVVSNAKVAGLPWSPKHSLRDGVAELVSGYQMPFGGPERNA